MVRYERPKTGEVQWYPGSCVAKYRGEEIPQYRKEFSKAAKQRFVKGASVFASWKPDDQFSV